MQRQSDELIGKVFEKLQNYKQKLIETISHGKMVDEIKKDI